MSDWTIEGDREETWGLGFVEEKEEEEEEDWQVEEEVEEEECEWDGEQRLLPPGTPEQVVDQSQRFLQPGSQYLITPAAHRCQAQWRGSSSGRVPPGPAAAADRPEGSQGERHLAAHGKTHRQGALGVVATGDGVGVEAGVGVGVGAGAGVGVGGGVVSGNQPSPAYNGNGMARSPPTALVRYLPENHEEGSAANDVFLAENAQDDRPVESICISPRPDVELGEGGVNNDGVPCIFPGDCSYYVRPEEAVVVNMEPEMGDVGEETVDADVDVFWSGMEFRYPPPPLPAQPPLCRAGVGGEGLLPLQSILRPHSEVRKLDIGGVHFEHAPVEFGRERSGTTSTSSAKDVTNQEELHGLAQEDLARMSMHQYHPHQHHLQQQQQQELQQILQQHGTQGRRSSKTFTVINYGNIGKEASTMKPTGREPVALMELLDVDDSTEAEPIRESVCEPTNAQRQLSWQSSEEMTVTDCSDWQSATDLTSPVSCRRKRILSIHHINPPNTTGSSCNKEDGDRGGTLLGDVVDDDAIDIWPLKDSANGASISLEQRTFDGSRCRRNPEVVAMAEYGKMYAKRKKNRLIQKDGTINVRPANISKRNFQFLRDIFTTLLDLSWWWVWAVFMMTFGLSWFGFATIWWLVAFTHGDLEQVEGASEQAAKCVIGIEDFRSALLFSIETQHTIGYGTRAIQTVCPLSFVVIMAQSLVGVVIQCVMAGVVFAKLAKPKHRAETIMFSKRATICLADGHYCLVFRVGDMRRSQLVGCTLHAFLVRNPINKDGRKSEFQRRHLEVVSESEDYDQYLFLAWPTKIIHRITSDSPLWEVCKETLLEEQFEIIVVLEGTIESSGMTTQIRTSYLPSEIEWGQGFLNLITEQTSHRSVEIDYSTFSTTESQAGMPEHSARQYNHQVAGTRGTNNSDTSNQSSDAWQNEARNMRKIAAMNNMCFYRC